MRCWILASLIALLGAGCGGEFDCETAQPGFELVVVAPRMEDSVQRIEVELAIDDASWRRSFDLGETLADGETSLFVAIDPPPENDFDAKLLVEGFDSEGRMTARGSARFDATADACNRFRLTLERTPMHREKGL